MKISARGEYGLRAMVFLASRQGGGLFSMQQIGSNGIVPLPFLAQILVDLRRANLIESVRGSKGGYRLCRPSQQIRVREVIEALAERLDVVDCLRTETCALSLSCPTRPFWRRVQRSLEEVMDHTTLADLTTGKGDIP
jgi:Rrf2 family cysteine metabolism transcriptional repressor